MAQYTDGHLTSGVPQEFQLGQVLFNIFINDKCIKCVPSKSVEGTELSGVVDTPE